MARSTRDVRPSHIQQEAPFLNYLRYKNATRPLQVKELVLLHKELDYVQRFTTRYKILFDDHIFKLDPNLYKKYDHMCEVLITMQGRKEHSAEHCNRAQIDLLTVGDVSQYIKEVSDFSHLRMRQLVHLGDYSGQFPHWRKDNRALHIMERNTQHLLEDISPLIDKVTPDPNGFVRKSGSDNQEDMNRFITPPIPDVPP
jgi:hypothetical protein